MLCGWPKFRRQGSKARSGTLIVLQTFQSRTGRFVVFPAECQQLPACPPILSVAQSASVPVLVNPAAVPRKECERLVLAAVCALFVSLQEHPNCRTQEVFCGLFRHGP